MLAVRPFRGLEGAEGYLVRRYARSSSASARSSRAKRVTVRRSESVIARRMKRKSVNGRSGPPPFSV
jgi:hypothetical protein